MRRAIFLFSIFFLIVSCDYGLKNGSDLEGQWAGFLGPGKNVSYTFYGNGRGTVYYSALDPFGVGAEASSTGFSYRITNRTPYKKLHIDIDNDKFSETYGKDSVYDYFFSPGKQNLHLRKRNTNVFLVFIKLPSF